MKNLVTASGILLVALCAAPVVAQAQDLCKPSLDECVKYRIGIGHADGSSKTYCVKTKNGCEVGDYYTQSACEARGKEANMDAARAKQACQAFDNGKIAFYSRQACIDRGVARGNTRSVADDWCSKNREGR